MSVGSIISRNLSDALSCNRRTAEAVSYRAIPFSLRNSMIRSLSNDFCPDVENDLYQKKDYSDDSPHIILQVGVEEIHTPSFLLGGKLPSINNTALPGRKGSNG